MDIIPKMKINGTAILLNIVIARIPTNAVAIIQIAAIMTTGIIGMDGNRVFTVAPISHASMENHDTQVITIRKTGIHIPAFPKE